MKNETIAYLILLSLATLSTQYTFVTVYFYLLQQVEYGFVFLLMTTVMRAVLAPTVLSVFKRFIRQLLLTSFLIQSLVAFLFFSNIYLNLFLVIVLGLITGIARTITVLIWGIFYSFSEPNFATRHKKSGLFLSSQFLGYIVGNVIASSLLFLSNIHIFYLVFSTLWVIPIILSLKLIISEDIRKLEVPSITESMKRLFNNVPPLLLLTYLVSLTLAAAGSSIEPLIFQKYNGNAAWFAISFILANVFGSLTSVYSPKIENQFVLLSIGGLLSVVTEFLFPYTPFLTILIIEGIASQIGNSMSWPVVMGLITRTSKTPVVESGFLASLTDIAWIINTLANIILYPLFNIYVLSIISIFSGIFWGLLIVRRQVFA